MDKIKTEAALQEEILLLEIRQAEEGKLVKEEFQAAYERLRPANIVRNMFHEKVSSPAIRENIIGKTMNVALVFLTNSLLRKTSNSFVKRTIGTVVVWGIKRIVTRNPEILQKAGIGIMKTVSNIVSKRNRNKEYAYNSHL